jgi:hypothetical protein
MLCEKLRIRKIFLREGDELAFGLEKGAFEFGGNVGYQAVKRYRLNQFLIFLRNLCRPLFANSSAKSAGAH